MGHFSIRLILPRNTREIRTACKRKIFAWYFWITSLAVCKRVTRVSGWRLSSSVPSENFCRSPAGLCCCGWKVSKILFPIIFHFPSLCWQSYNRQWWVGSVPLWGRTGTRKSIVKKDSLGKQYVGRYSIEPRGTQSKDVLGSVYSNLLFLNMREAGSGAERWVAWSSAGFMEDLPKP